MNIFSNIKDELKSYFNLSADLDNLEEAQQSIRTGVSFKGSNIVILILAIFVASLGLNTNSTAVIIGAMLISPLMGPIIGIGLGVGIYDFALIKRSTRNLIVASLLSVATATVYFLISPVSEGHSELLARTSPTIYDVLIGFFGGAAGIVAIACKNKGNVIPGVAIATALMPPLCTAGYGLATWQLQYFFGAFYLFLINSIFIAYATLLGVKLMGFKEATFVDPIRKRRVKRIVYTIVVITLVPSIYLTAMMLRDSVYQREAAEFVETEFDYPNTQVFSKKIYTRGWEKYIDVTLIGEKLDTDSLKDIMTKRLNLTPMLGGTHLSITQGITFNSVNASAGSKNAGGVKDVVDAMMGQLDRQNRIIDSLRRIDRRLVGLDTLSQMVAPEIKVLYPSVNRMAISRMVVSDIPTGKVDTVNIAIIESNGRNIDLTRLKAYLEARTHLDSIRVIQPRTRL